MQPEFKPHPTGICPPGRTLQINSMTMEQVCAPPGSYPHYLAKSNTWVMVPGDWVLVTDPTTGKMKYVPPR